MTPRRRAVVLSPFVRVGLVAIPLMLVFAISGNALTVLHVDYVTPAGALYGKIHPGTYLAVLSWSALYFGGSAVAIDNVLFSRRERLIYYIASMFALLLYIVLCLSVPFTHFPDNWLLPAIVLMMFAALSRSETRVIARLLDLLMLANSLLGLFEVGTNWRFISLSIYSSVLGQWTYPYEWRATALLGHPLSNSYVVGSYLVALMITNRIPRLSIRVPLMGLHILALSAFGSRAAAAFFAVAMVIYVTHGLIRGAVVRRVARDIVVYLGAIVLSVVVLIPLVLSSGFADRYIERFNNDGGSAHARGIALDLISEFSFSDLLIGPPAALVFQIEKRYGILAIESFWLHSLVTFGIIGCSIFFPMIYWLCRCVVRQSGPASGAILLYFFACCSTSISMGTKTTILAVVVAICLTNDEKGPVRVARPLRRPGPSRALAGRPGVPA